MIPECDIRPGILDPPPSCPLPKRHEIPEENWGGFRDTWYLGQVPPVEAGEVLVHEGRALACLDHVATNQEEFELLAQALEWGEIDDLPPPFLKAFNEKGMKELMRDPDDFSPLGGLEIGVAGLVHVLSAIGCVTAASCRWHGETSWSDCPVVFFAAPDQKVEILAKLIREEGCGLRESRGLLVIEASSVTDLHSLAELIFEEIGRFQAS
mgnify:CR=1 FL=1